MFVKKETGVHRGYGKLILFGEHLVVYGAPAIAFAVSASTTCQLKLLDISEVGLSEIEYCSRYLLCNQQGFLYLLVEDNRPAVCGYKMAKKNEQINAHRLVLEHLGIICDSGANTGGDVHGECVTVLCIVLGGDLVAASGIGASAANVVLLSRALNELCDLSLTEEAINEAAYAGECGYHGTPSGIDNTVSTYNAFIHYQKGPNNRGKFMHLVAKPMEFHFIVVSTGITSNTTEVVGIVRQFKEFKGPEWWEANVLVPYAQLFSAAEKAFEKGDQRVIGKLMLDNHAICKAIQVSSNEIESILEATRHFSSAHIDTILGTKLTGTGRGGIVLILTQSTEAQDQLKTYLEDNCIEAKHVWKYDAQTG